MTNGSVWWLPGWLEEHQYRNRTYDTLTEEEVNNLKERLSAFSPDTPEVSVVIPAWNEENTVFRTLSSLSSSTTNKRVEIIVINNNSTDRTQELLDRLAVRSFLQQEQGISFARQLGLEKAKGIFHLCADSDTIYPPEWIDTMIAPMEKDQRIVCVYGRYSFIPKGGVQRLYYIIYETLTGLLIRMRKKEQRYMNVLGFNMGFVTARARNTKGFEVVSARKFANSAEGGEYVDESEDGRMAQRLAECGKLKLVGSQKARVFTSSRRLDAEGGVFQAFKRRMIAHLTRLF